MYQMEYYIEIMDEKEWVPAFLISEIYIERSIKNLADFATITCPIFSLNKLMLFKEDINDEGQPKNKIYKLYKRGHKIRIFLGYNANLKLEFVGYIKEVKTDNDFLKIECEDELFRFRKKIKDKQFSQASLKTILKYVIDSVDSQIKLDCDYDMVYETFTIYQADAIDVLKQIQQDTGADIYFQSILSEMIGKNFQKTEILIDSLSFKDSESDITEKKSKKSEASKSENLSLNAVLKVKMPYIENQKITESHCDYSFQHNIENATLEYIDTTDEKVKVKIITHNKNGTTNEVEYGNTGGEEFEFKINRISRDAMKKRAKQEFDRLMKPGYTGNFTGWLIPYVAPGYSIGIYDNDFPEKDGIYMVESVITTFSEQGGVRQISPGIKLSENK